MNLLLIIILYIQCVSAYLVESKSILLAAFCFCYFWKEGEGGMESLNETRLYMGCLKLIKLSQL